LRPPFRRTFVHARTLGLALSLAAILAAGAAESRTRRHHEPPVSTPPDTEVMRPAVAPRQSSNDWNSGASPYKPEGGSNPVTVY
jgi:hypothetical protein